MGGLARTQHVYTCTHSGMHACMHACTVHAYIHAHAYIHGVHAYIHGVHAYIHACIHHHIRAYILAYTYTCAYIHTTQGAVGDLIEAMRMHEDNAGMSLCIALDYWSLRSAQVCQKRLSMEEKRLSKETEYAGKETVKRD